MSSLTVNVRTHHTRHSQASGIHQTVRDQSSYQSLYSSALHRSRLHKGGNPISYDRVHLQDDWRIWVLGELEPDNKDFVNVKVFPKCSDETKILSDFVVYLRDLMKNHSHKVKHITKNTSWFNVY